MRTLVICSGGLDSVTLAYEVAQAGNLSGLLSFDYGQRHVKELGFAKLAGERLGVSHDIIDLTSLTHLLPGSALTDDVDVPDGHYAAESMKSTVVPNRNAIMLALAFGVASARGDGAVATAVHGGDHFIYADCRPGFIDAFAKMEVQALEGQGDVALLAPYVQIDKAGIIAKGAKIDVPFEETWSCYKGGEVQCGRCGTCVERAEAFALAGVDDPTVYADPDYWKTATKESA